MKSFIALLALLLALGAAGCDSHEIGGATIPSTLTFDILLPLNQTPADYYAESGIVLRTQQTKIGDSIVELNSSSFFAQFRAARGNHPPSQVTLNGNALTPLAAGSDTLRLGSGSISGQSLYGDNVWLLRDSTGDSASFTTAKLDGIDSVTPFTGASQRTFRRDTGITVKWKRPASGSSGMFITWVGPSHTYTQPVNDNIGVFDIPREELQKLAGKGKIYFTRYTNFEKSFKGKTVILKRLAQRAYEVTIE